MATLVVEEHLYPAGQSTQVENAAYEYVPLVQAVFIPLMQA